MTEHTQVTTDTTEKSKKRFRLGWVDELKRLKRSLQEDDFQNDNTPPKPKIDLDKIDSERKKSFQEIAERVAVQHRQNFQENPTADLESQLIPSDIIREIHKKFPEDPDAQIAIFIMARDLINGKTPTNPEPEPPSPPTPEPPTPPETPGLGERKKNIQEWAEAIVELRKAYEADGNPRNEEIEKIIVEARAKYGQDVSSEIYTEADRQMRDAEQIETNDLNEVSKRLQIEGFVDQIVEIIKLSPANLNEEIDRIIRQEAIGEAGLTTEDVRTIFVEVKKTLLPEEKKADATSPELNSQPENSDENAKRKFAQRIARLNDDKNKISPKRRSTLFAGITQEIQQRFPDNPEIEQEILTMANEIVIKEQTEQNEQVLEFTPGERTLDFNIPIESRISEQERQRLIQLQKNLNASLEPQKPVSRRQRLADFFGETVWRSRKANNPLNLTPKQIAEAEVEGLELAKKIETEEAEETQTPLVTEPEQKDQNTPNVTESEDTGLRLRQENGKVFYHEQEVILSPQPENRPPTDIELGGFEAMVEDLNLEIEADTQKPKAIPQKRFSWTYKDGSEGTAWDVNKVVYFKDKGILILIAKGTLDENKEQYFGVSATNLETLKAA